MCSKCAKRGNFANVDQCRSTNVKYLEDRNDEQQHETETENDITDNFPVAFAVFTSKDGWEECQVDKFSVMAISEASEVKKKLIQLVGR